LYRVSQNCLSMGPATRRTKNELQQLQQQKINNSTNEVELLNVRNARHN